MKVEDYFILTISEFLNIDKENVADHFRSFRKKHRRFPKVIQSLDKEVTDKIGRPLTEGNSYLKNKNGSAFTKKKTKILSKSPYWTF